MWEGKITLPIFFIRRKGMVTVYKVADGSLAAKAGIRVGDVIVSVNGKEICDVLDYDFYTSDEKLKLLVHRGAELLEFKIKKGQYESLGCEFETYLMDEKHSCRNKCVFCFIDQNPEGMRETVYFKDDDSRMSFISGNYITLTNLSEKEVCRIIDMHISPINISVHTTDPELRCRMMNNRFAGESLKYMRRFADAGIWMNAQIVACPEINDGEALKRTLTDLEEYLPALQSVAVVPVGLTKHRCGLEPLKAYTKESARELIALVDGFGNEFLKKYGTRLCFCSDEFYLKAELPLPNEDFYEGYPQLDNGVGLLRSLTEELRFALEDTEGAKEPKEFSVVTGYAAYHTLCALRDEVQKELFGGKEICKIYKIRNDFFGESVTVAGLVTGKDILAQLKGLPLGEKLYIPKVMLRYEMDKFLDDTEVEELEKELGVPVCITDTDGESFLQMFIGNEVAE